MMVTFISQCEKKSLDKTRRVLDAFANRIGERTWQTIITEEGLIAVKKLLRQTATKNTAVACHWMRSRSRSELVWVVGNRRKFNEEGVVPVNSTKKNHQHNEWEKGWVNTEIIALASGIAGLFHDFGKANDLFQDKLNPKIQATRSEPYRHEWVSLRLFQAFVADHSEEGWITELGKVSIDSINIENRVLTNLVIDHTCEVFNDPFENLPHFAKLVAWLIVSHHRLPVFQCGNDNRVEPDINQIDTWFTNDFDNNWNSTNNQNPGWTDEERLKNWSFTLGTPLRSKTWQDKAAQLSKRALKCAGLSGQDWLGQTFTMHLSRLALMLSDHFYSAQEANIVWQDASYLAYANTNKEKQLKQKLDEHNAAVGHCAYLLSKDLAHLRAKNEFPNLGFNQTLAKGLGYHADFAWQDKAYLLAKTLGLKANNNGFFGINMASTGRGKTIANIRIMYALADEDLGCRLSIAMGLRTLTLQTGQALIKKLELETDEVATLIGSQAVLKLFGRQNNDEMNATEQHFSVIGSESLENEGDRDFNVEYNVSIYDGFLKKWFNERPKIQKLLHAPVLVSTIDHLTPATEGVRGGKQIAPILRLLTSDLVLDEPDEFGLDDLPALARLVNWAGMLGSKVLLSTATMPPAMAYALFEAYQTGRKAFNEATQANPKNASIVCAWFDEFQATQADSADIQNYIKSHDEFVVKRIKQLDKASLNCRKAKIVETQQHADYSPIQNLAKVIQHNIFELHQNHHQTHVQGKKISIGLVRMANTKPLVAVAQELLSMSVPEDSRIHYCIYHSKFTLAQRAHIEYKLDLVLDRKEEQAIWQFPEIKQAIETHSENNQIFVVLATSVAEVGRDHDYDWAIAEPSSMRSLIQLSGRIQRHRKKSVQTENLYLLSKNYKSLIGINPAFNRPGFETNSRALAYHDLNQILSLEQYEYPSSKPSIQTPKASQKSPFTNLVNLEHVAYCQVLLGILQNPDDNDIKNKNARLWWKNKATWCAELQRRQSFRKSGADRAYYLFINSESEKIWQLKNEKIYPNAYAEVSDIQNVELDFSDRNQAWFDMDEIARYKVLAKEFEKSVESMSHYFGEVRIQVFNENEDVRRQYNPLLGIFEKLQEV